MLLTQTQRVAVESLTDEDLVSLARGRDEAGVRAMVQAMNGTVRLLAWPDDAKRPLTPDGKPSPDRKLITKIRLDPTFFDCLADQKFRDRARRILIETEPYFFPEERTALCSMLQIKPPAPGIRRGLRSQTRAEL